MTTEDTTTTTNETTDTGTTTPGLAPETETATSEPVEQPKNANSEAAKYRTQLRAAEAERDTLTGRLEQAHRTMVETIASKHLAKPEALWMSGAQIEDMLDGDGNIDSEKVTAAVVDIKERFGLQKPLYGPIVPDVGKTPTYRPSMKQGFADAFGPDSM